MELSEAEWELLRGVRMASEDMRGPVSIQARDGELAMGLWSQDLLLAYPDGEGWTTSEEADRLLDERG